MPYKYNPEKRLATFWSKVDRSGGEDACWIWIARRNPKGYGQINWNGRVEQAHRVSYFLAHGEMPGKLMVLHSCDNPSCINPKHLLLGTNLDNQRDCVAKNRQAQGEEKPCHKLTDEQVLEIRRRFVPHSKDGNSGRQLAVEFNVHYGTICSIIRRKAWRHLA